MKRPREYAAEIVELNNREERRRALVKVPAELQEMVKTHVQIFWALRQRRG